MSKNNQENSPPEVIYVLDYKDNEMGISAQYHEEELRKAFGRIAKQRNVSQVTITFIYPHDEDATK